MTDTGEQNGAYAHGSIKQLIGTKTNPIPDQEEIAKLKEERDRVISTLMEVEKAKLLAHNQWWAVREERNALLEGLKELECRSDHIPSIVCLVRSLIAKIEGSKPNA